ncbi:uncharacterized protein N7483_000516 [Penicillium malachiteum]|uniref:uncharacterized protein n=1 Tax=Penicillium malachiteum TaxID=1324776 RepID=UPI002548F38D|nr:uncharacterized protein N7483_000516 [Penicillium malachiteum]KAJ5735391.1 hypothetical protein N7483_000516 [Penicillium malachiteum]
MAKKFTRKGPSLKWNFVMREVLCCLFLFFDHEKKKFPEIFTEIFGDEIRNQGIDPQEKVTQKVLYTQWYWMQRETHAIWNHVHKKTKFRGEEFNGLIEKIEAAAERLGLSMERTKDDTDQSEPGGLLNVGRGDRALTTPEQLSDWQNNDLRVRQMPTPSTLDSYAQTHPEDEEDMMHTKEFEPIVNGCGKRCFWCFKEELERDSSKPEEMDVLHEADRNAHNKSGIGHFWQEPTGNGQQEMGPEEAPLIEFRKIPGRCPPYQMPAVLFRWYNVDSQGINAEDLLLGGLFTDPKVDLEVDHLPKHEFLEMFENHVSKAKCPSPFISTFLHPLSPIHRAIRKQKQARVTMIDTSKLGADAVVIKASTLVPITNTRTRKWRGFGEYLIWKEVPRDAILGTFKITRLEQIAMDWVGIGGFLQLDKLRNTRFSDPTLYREIADNLVSMSVEELDDALENLMILLEVPHEFKEAVKQSFKKSWTSMGQLGGTTEEQGLGPQSFQHGFIGVADDSSEDGETYPFAETNDLGTNDEGPQHPRQEGDRPYIGQAEPEIPYEPTHHGSVSSSDTSEESEPYADSEEAERCPPSRYDTPSPEFSTHDDDDEDDDLHDKNDDPPEATMEGMTIEIFSPGPSTQGRWVLSPVPNNFYRPDGESDSNVA